MKSKRQQQLTKSRRADVAYGRQLRAVAKQIGIIVNGFAPKGEVKQPNDLLVALRKYSELLGPWARIIAGKMLADVSRRDEAMWNSLSEKVGRNLRAEIENTPTGTLMAKAMEEQVRLITSLPLEAAQRVHDLVMEQQLDSTRASEIAKEIMRSGEVAKSRANLIARTEVSRTAAELTKARATQAGVTHFIWRTSGDADVRSDHKKLNGKVYAFTDPPIADRRTGEKALPGGIYNCRCYIQPIIPEE